MTLRRFPITVSTLLVTTLGLACAAASEDETLHARSACGDPALAAQPDGDSNPRGWVEIACDAEAGERLVGLVNHDYAWDSLDAVSALCEAPGGTVRTVSNDADLSNSSATPEPVLCPPGEHVVAIEYRDAPYWPGVPGDSTDAATVVCSGSPTPLAVDDLDGNGEALHESSCGEGQIATGLAYVDRDGTYSDLTDAITPICDDDCGTCEPTLDAVPNADADANPRPRSRFVCDEDETFVGIVYVDYWWDSVDSTGIRCQDAAGNVRELTNTIDWSNAHGDETTIVCNPGEVVTGIAYKDSEPVPGVTGDPTDGTTVLCDGGDPEEVDDLDDNPNPLQVFSCPAGTVAAGIEYVDSDTIYSDLTDALTVVCRTPCS